MFTVAEFFLEGLLFEAKVLKTIRPKKNRKLQKSALKESVKLINNSVSHLKKKFLQRQAGDALEQVLALLFRKKEGRGDEEDKAGKTVCRNTASCDICVKIAKVLAERLTIPKCEALPKSRRVQEMLTSFGASLLNRRLDHPPSLATMISCTSMIAVHQEDVLYPMDRKEAAGVCGLDLEGNIGTVTDLVTETGTRVSLLAHLRNAHPHEWMNFLERMRDNFGIECGDAEELSELEFCRGGTFHAHQQELLLWASYRGQLLSRTVPISRKRWIIKCDHCAFQIRGMMLFEKALKHIALLEHPRPGHIPDASYRFAIEQCVATKFRSTCTPIS